MQRLNTRLGRVAGLAVLGTSAFGCGVTATPRLAAQPAAPHFRAVEWPEGNPLFRGDRHFVGADGAYSVALGADRVLWLFADTFVDGSGSGKRTGPAVRMVGNSLALQHGLDPSSARFEFLLRTDRAGVPRPYFPADGNDRFWPGDAVLLDDRLLVFLMRVHPTTTGLGFDVTGWDAVLVKGIDREPSEWVVEDLEVPDPTSAIHIGAGPVLADAEHVFAFSPGEPGGTQVYLARFARASAARGDLSRFEWWSGERGFVAHDAVDHPTPVFAAAAPEFTIHYDDRTSRYLAFEATGFGAADLQVRHAESLTGPWSALEFLHAPELKARPNTLIYQGKAHPELLAEHADVVLTYCSNDLDFERLRNDESIYFPRFVKVIRE